MKIEDFAYIVETKKSLRLTLIPINNSSLAIDMFSAKFFKFREVLAEKLRKNGKIVKKFR